MSHQGCFSTFEVDLANPIIATDKIKIDAIESRIVINLGCLRIDRPEIATIQWLRFNYGLSNSQHDRTKIETLSITSLFRSQFRK
jgi:hypothetical protein